MVQRRNTQKTKRIPKRVFRQSSPPFIQRKRHRRIISDSSDISEEENIDGQPGTSRSKEVVDSILGADPSEGKHEFGPPLNCNIINRWANYISNGFDKETRDGWCNIKIPENGKFLDAPKLNPEIEAGLNNLEINKDLFLASIQTKLGKSLSSIGISLERTLERDTPSTDEATRNIVEAAKILCEAHFLLSMHRKHQLYPLIGDNIVRKVANEAKTDTWLFGNDFNERSKAAHDVQKSAAGLGLKKKSASFDRPSTSRQHLNSRRPFPRPKFKPRFDRSGRDRKFPIRQQYSSRRREDRKNRK